MCIAGLLAQPFGTLAPLIAAQAVARPRHDALVHGQRRITYGGLDRLMDRVAAALQRDGISPQTVIAVSAANSIEFVGVFLGALRAGVAIAPIVPSGTPESIAEVIRDSGARLLFQDAGAARAISCKGIPASVKCITLDGSGTGLRFGEWLAPQDARPADVEIRPDWPFNIIYSSGTTEAPKGIVQSHRMRWYQIVRSAAFGYDQEAVTIISIPLHSNTALVSLIPTLAGGGTAVLMEKFDAGRFLELAHEHGATHAMLVPVQYRRIMDHSAFDSYDLSSFRMKFATSAPFTAALKAEVLERWPGGLVEFFGLTEGGCTSILVAHEHPDKLHTVGRPAPGHDIRLIDEQDREVALDEVGEVIGHSPAMMNGYHNRPERTAEVEWRDATGKRFIRSGDLGRFDADGFLTVMDRKKDIIISGGFNIYSTDLEAVLQKHPEVAESAVIGVSSHRWGETPVALVVLKPGAQIQSEALRAWANERLGKIQRLTAVALVDSLPRSSVGKVLKRELRDRYSSAALQHESPQG